MLVRRRQTDGFGRRRESEKVKAIDDGGELIDFISFVRSSLTSPPSLPSVVTRLPKGLRMAPDAPADARLASRWVGFPVEIWDEILSFVPPTQLQRTVHSLVLAFPRCAVSRAHMFRHIVIKRDEQVVTLRARLAEASRAARETGDDEDGGGDDGVTGVTKVARTMRVHGWRWRDNNVVLNLVREFGHLRALELYVGPVFGVDQLEELFLSSWGRLEMLSLRFNQYYQRRNCKWSLPRSRKVADGSFADEPFLRGAYFDSSIQYLSQWPASPRFRSFSFVQDVPPVYTPTGNSHDGIAQPIVLFKTWCLSILATSPIAQCIEHLRIRIPNRSLLVPLTTTQTSSTTTSLSHTTVPSSGVPSIFPSVQLLDLSTSYLPTELSYSTLLRRHQSLRHLILDRSGLLPTFRIDSSLSADDRHTEISRGLGKATAAVGVVRALEATRCWRALRKEMEESRVATLRDRPPPPSGPSGGTRRRPKGRSAFASEPRWKKKEAEAERTSKDGGSTSRNVTAAPKRSKIPSKLIIVPAPGLLRSLCVGVDVLSHGASVPSPAPASAEEMAIRQEWTDAWEEGWRLGLDRLEEAVEEKLRDWSIAITAWDREHPAEDTDGASSDGEDDNEEGRPRLVTFVPSAAGPSTISSDPVESFLTSFHLADTTPAQARVVVAEAIASDPCVFCTIPDCEGVGKVAWVDPSLDRYAYRAPGILQEANDEGQATGTEAKKVDLVEEEKEGMEASTLRPLEEHARGCGHAAGRMVWDPDRW